MTLIKICGLKDPLIAYQTAKAGAHFIGIVLDPLSKRYVSLEKAKEIAKASMEGGAKPIAVLTFQKLEEILFICYELPIAGVQLHGINADKNLKSIPPQLLTFFVSSFHSKPSLSVSPTFYLYDSPLPGSGKSFDWNSFSKPKQQKFFIAGGLNEENVSQAIWQFNPTGVDISTGVESLLTGQKDIKRIKSFIRQVGLASSLKDVDKK